MQGEFMSLVKKERVRYVKYANLEAEEVIVDGTYSHSSEGKFGIQHYFESEQGHTICLNKAGMLDKFVESSLWEGRRVKIGYGGKNPIEKGPYAGKEAHVFEFYIDPTEKKTIASGLAQVNPDELD